MDGSITMVRDKSVWVAADHRFNSAWLYRLTAVDLAEIDAAVAAVRGKGLLPPNFDASDFPIPAFGATLACFARDLEQTAKIPTN